MVVAGEHLLDHASMSMRASISVWLLSAVQAACCCTSSQVSPQWVRQLSHLPLRKLELCVAQLDDEAAILACVSELPATLRKLALNVQLGFSSAVEHTIRSSPFSTWQATTLRQVRGPPDVRNFCCSYGICCRTSNPCGECVAAVRCPLHCYPMTMFKRKSTSKTNQ